MKNISNWQPIKLKYLADLRSGETITSELIEKEEEYPVYGGGALRGYTNNYTHNGKYILIGRQGANCGSVRKVNGKFYASEHAIVVTHNKKVDYQWLYYLLDSMNLNQYSIAAAQPGLSVYTIKNLTIKLPNINEQIKIRDYINSKLTVFTETLALKEKLIALLEERRQSIITEIVTRGLNINVKMKDSGVEWLGKIPEHWEMVKVKYLVNEKLSYGANEAAELDDENLPRYIRITDINEKGELKQNTFKSVPIEIANKYPVEKGDILLARSGATVGKSYLHDSEVAASYAGYLIKLSFSKYFLANYIYLFTNSSIYKKWINSILIQATIQNVSAEKYGNLKVPIPPDTEINEIVEYLNEINTDYRNLISKVEIQIEQLIEYRQSLIYEAVTGKTDVCELIIQK